MSKMHCRYYYELATGPKGSPLLVGQEPAMGEVVDYSLGESVTGALPDTARFVRIICDTDALIDFGEGSPVVGAGAVLVRAGSAEYFGLQSNAIKIAVKSAI